MISLPVLGYFAAFVYWSTEPHLKHIEKKSEILMFLITGMSSMKQFFPW